MPTASNGDVEIHYETFGSADDPVLLLVNGLGSPSINWADDWCKQFASHGFQVVRFDNRDTGRSSKLDDQTYAIADMALDALAVLDAVGAATAHVMGVSMGGMIVQRLAIDHRERLLSMTSVMSRSGDPDTGQSSPEAIAVLLAKPAASREEFIDNHVAALGVYGSKPEWVDAGLARARAGAAYDYCFCPAGVGRQMTAVLADGDRSEALRGVTTPTLVLHGSRDTLIAPSGGRQVADLVPGARYVEIDGMGHDYPPPVWDVWTATWLDFVRGL